MAKSGNEKAKRPSRKVQNTFFTHRMTQRREPAFMDTYITMTGHVSIDLVTWREWTEEDGYIGYIE